MTPVYVPLVVLLITAFLTPLIGIRFKLFRRALVVSAFFFSFFFWISLLPTVFSGKILTYNMNLWPPPFGITLVLDSLSLFILVVVSGLGLAIVSVVENFIKERRSEFYSLFLLMHVGMTGILITGDLFNMFVFTEIMVISSYGLAIFERSKKALEAGIKYLVVGAFATSLILLGIGLTYGMTGTLNMADLMSKISLAKAFVPLSLILAGYLTEIGIVPFHFWKPDVIEGVNLPLAAMIASVSTTVGCYAILRVLFVFGFPHAPLIALGTISMVVGAFMALIQSNIKRMLAYSSVSQMGYVLFAFGLGTYGFLGGIFHLLNNALLKMVMFLIVGSVEEEQVNMPVTGACFLIASLGIAGVPPLNGFVSKFLIYDAGIRSGFLIPTVVAIVISVITLAYYLRAFRRMFSNSGRRVKEKRDFLVPILVLTSFCIFLGVFSFVAIQALRPVVGSLLARSAYSCAVFGC